MCGEEKMTTARRKKKMRQEKEAEEAITHTICR